jgi:rod shape-determining protein MreD
MSSHPIFDRFEWILKLALAHGAILFLVLLNGVSFSIPHGGDFKPVFFLMAIYFWSIYRPTLTPLFYVFALGLLVDLQAGMPLGANALLLTILHSVVQRQRIFLMGQSFMILWLVFGMVAAVYGAALWLIMSVYLWSLQSIAPALFSFALSILIFPAISYVLLVMHRFLPLPPAGFLR